MENKDFLEPLKFGPGDGQLNYYLFNWKIRNVTSAEIGLVLL
jgi:glycylpeptide N-tetradecanoyltransferase